MVDLILNGNGLLVRSNDLVIGNSDNQNITDILTAEKGEFKRTPQIGCGANNFINSVIDYQNIKSIISLNLTLDGFLVTDVEINKTDEGLDIIPYAERV